MTEHQDDRSQEQSDSVDKIRSDLAAGFAFVRSREVTASVATITFEEAVQTAIDDISVDRSDIRISKLTAVRRLRESLVQAVDQVQNLPASMFERSPGQGAANTNPDGTGPSDEEEQDGEE